MATTKKVSEKQTQDESLFERLDATKGLRDFAREHIVNPSVSYTQSKGSRLSGALEFLRKFSVSFTNADDLVKYAKHVASGTSADLGHLRPMWDYWARGQKACVGFLDSLVDESALRYACANKQHVIVGAGEDKLRVQLSLDGSLVARYEYIASILPAKLRAVRKRIKEDDGGKLDRVELVDIVESAAVKLSTAKGVSAESAQWRAEETAKRAVKSVVSDSETKRLPNTNLAYDEYVRLMEKLANNVPEQFPSVVVIESAELARAKGTAQETAHDADLWGILKGIADFGGIPQGADEVLVENVMRVVGKVKNLCVPFFSGDLTPGVKIAGNGKAIAQMPVGAD